jgi:hypothetical protein
MAIILQPNEMARATALSLPRAPVTSQHRADFERFGGRRKGLMLFHAAGPEY